jgi:UMF1 family MFS transporter
MTMNNPSMDTVSPALTLTEISEKEYKRRINAWVMYDWANSAFATTILAAVLPVYYSQVAGANLPSDATATAYWSLGLSISLLIVAILSPILGTVSDVMRGKKKLLAIFAGIGILGTALLVFVESGDWMLASILAILGRVGFNGSLVFYDALLAHVARPADQDRVSARGYALGYLGGGLLLAANVLMIFLLPGTWGPRMSFLSVAIWWAVFSIPLFLRVPEPAAATMKLAAGETILRATFKRLGGVIHDLRRFRELAKYLVAFLIYNDGIGTIMSIAAIYGAELGFGSVELILALLLVQFVGIPFSLIFGVLPSQTEKRRPIYLAFVVFNLVCLPLVGSAATRMLPIHISGAPQPAYETTASAIGEGTYPIDDAHFAFEGNWKEMTSPDNVRYRTSQHMGDVIEIPFNGQRLSLIYITGPQQGIWDLELDGKPLIDQKSGETVHIDGYQATLRYDSTQTLDAGSPGAHVLRLVNSGKNPIAKGMNNALAQVKILPPIRQSNLGLILGLILALEAVGILFAWLFGNLIFGRLARQLDTKRSIILSLLVYSVVAIWGFFLNSIVEYWFLAWMVAVVQGGSQALSRSLYAYMSPASKSGEFFGLFSVMEKFASLIGPMLFVLAGLMFGSSRPAILSLIVLFILGTYILTRVNVAEGRRVALEEDAAGLATAE